MSGSFSTLVLGVKRAVKLLLTIPVAVYHHLLSLCGFSSQEYAILKNGVIRGIDDDDEKAVDIFCDSDSAKKLLAWPTQVDPAAASQITVDADPT